jgi:hypothetical protein
MRGSLLNGAKYFPENYLSRHLLSNLMTFNGFEFFETLKGFISVTGTAYDVW